MTTEIVLSTDVLKKSTSNVRAGHSKEAIKMMANSIKHRGIINPPSVAKNGDGKYEIIAGQLRVAGAIAAGLSEIKCEDVTSLTDAERVDLSLAENHDRREMSEIELHRAFDKLFKSGRTVPEIASSYNTTEKDVQRTLAVGGLPKKILDDAEAGLIGDRTLRALALASKKDVARYVKLPKKDRPRDWDIQKWLYVDGQFLASHALFDLDTYDGGTITDLFSEDDEVWLTDGAQFWVKQQKALASKIEEYEKKGWKVKQVDSFQSWAYDRVAKAKGGMVLFEINERSGEVRFHVGYTRQKAAGKEPAPEGKTTKEAKPEISQAFKGFMAETRHMAVKAFMVQNKRAGMEATLALLLKHADNIDFRNGGVNLSDTYSDSLHSSDNFIYVHDAYCEMLKELGLKMGHTWDMDVAKIVVKLNEYTPAQLVEWIILTVAHEWQTIGNTTTDALGRSLEIVEVSNWEADDAFWNGITNKKTLLAIAKENSITMGPDAPLKKMRARLKENVPNSWRPSWLKF